MTAPGGGGADELLLPCPAGCGRPYHGPPCPTVSPARGGADEIREQVAAELRSRNVWWAEDTDGPLDALLSGPLAPLLADRETLRGARELAQDWKRYRVLPSDLANRLLHVLDGTP